MWKKFLIAVLVLTVIGIVFAQSADYIMSLFVSQRIVMSDDRTNSGTSAEIYFEATEQDQGEYIYSSADGYLDIIGATALNCSIPRINAGTNFWADAPSMADNHVNNGFHYFNDFIGVVPFPASTGTAGGWKSQGDATYDVLSAAGTLGGWCVLNAEAGSNNEVYMQMGEKGTETFVEFTENNGKEVWFEVNLTPQSVTNAANFIVGLAQEGSAAANFIVDAGNDIDDKDVVGFVVWEGDPNALAALWQKSGSAFIDTFETAITAANMTLGIHFDGGTTINWYVDGTSIGSITDLDLSLYGGSNDFPKGEELAPILAVKQGAANGGINMDWIKLVAER